ncbi:MAG: hypothetical protein CW338_10905, partial [Clostridiales bacterium]|nr:hypothetical protein [Clostridiales bacterium]
SYTVEYRTDISGVTNWHEMSVTSVYEDEIVFGFAEKDLEITKRHLEDKRYDEYLALFVVDLDTEMIKPLKISPLFATAGVGESVPYEPGMKKFAVQYDGETKEFFMQISDLKNVREELAKDDKRTYSYKSEKLTGDKWIDVISYVILRHEDGTPAMITLGFTVVDALATVRKELLSRLTEDVQMIGGLASEYYALYYLNINENFFKVYSLDGKKLPKAAAIVGQGGNPADVFGQFAQSDLIHPDDRHLFACLTIEELRKRLAHSKRFSVRFRRNHSDGYRWTEMDVVKYENADEPANAIAIGFAERDALIRSEQAINSSFDVLGQELSPDESIDRILSIAGDFYGADRCYVFEYNRDTGIINNTYEWCAGGIEPMIGKLQNLPAGVVEGWNREFERQGAFYMDALDSEHNTEETVAILEMQGIESLVAAPLMNGDEIVGFIGVDNPAKAKADINILEKASSVVYSEILKRRENDEEHITMGKLTDAFLSVYFADLSTDYMRTWKIDEEYKEAYGAVQNYSVAMGGYVRENIAERDRERCIRMTSPEYILEQFRSTDRFSIGMTDIMLGYERSIVMDYIKVNEAGTQFVVCSRDVTETLEKEREQQKLLQDALEKEITRAQEEKAYQLAILNNAYSYFRINLSRNRIIPPIIEREHGQPVDYTGKFPDPLPSYEQVIASGAERYVADSYKESYKAYGNCAYLTRCFDEGNLMPEYTCYIYSTTIGWHYRKYITYLSKDEVSGDIFGMTVAYDVTKEYEAAEIEKRYKLELEDARVAADAANQAKTNFLFNMSHDIRTPMNAIRGFTIMAKKNAGDESKVLEYLEKIDISGDQLLKLINQVLEMARIESGKITFDEKPVNVREEFNSMVTVLSEQARENGLNFTYTLGNVEHNHLLADEARISSITLNISGNAMKYTPEGGSIDFSLKEIESRKPGYATYVYTVSDTGIGMSREFLKELYEPFAREKNSTVSRIQGTGLGLSIVKNLIDLMGGNIEVQSEPGKGTRFEITLDFRIDDAAGQTGDESTGIGLISFEGRRVLLAEDNEMNREIARDILEEQGIIVEDAEDGDVAVSMVQAATDRGDWHYYDFILMDVQMPRMNGYEATKAIRAISVPDGVHIPIIAMTANAFEEDRRNALAAGMDEHLAKPIDVQKMFRTIARFL